jgi:hypothetical protein
MQGPVLEPEALELRLYEPSRVRARVNSHVGNSSEVGIGV